MNKHIIFFWILWKLLLLKYYVPHINKRLQYIHAKFHDSKNNFKLFDRISLKKEFEMLYRSEMTSFSLSNMVWGAFISGNKFVLNMTIATLTDHEINYDIKLKSYNLDKCCIQCPVN